MLNKGLNIAIIGANGAIGGQFVKTLAKNYEPKSIYAFSRSKIDFGLKNVHSHFINVEDEESIEEASKIASQNSKIDLVIVAIGILHDANLQPEKSLRDLDQEKFQKIFAINTIAPAIIAKHFLPKLNKENNAIFAALSARVGSISDNHLGGWYAYRASKAALNMLLKNCSIELKRSNKNAIILGLHPGTVDSNLSKPFQTAVKTEKLFTPEFCIQNLIKNVLNQKTPQDSGNIFDFNGLKIEF